MRRQMNMTGMAAMLVSWAWVLGPLLAAAAPVDQADPAPAIANAGRAQAAPAPAPVSPPAPSPQNGCDAGGCRDAAGVRYNGGVGNAVIGPDGKVCNRNGAWLQCF